MTKIGSRTNHFQTGTNVVKGTQYRREVGTHRKTIQGNQRKDRKNNDHISRQIGIGIVQDLLIHRTAVVADHFHLPGIQHLADVPADTFQQKQQTGHFQTAAGGTGAGTHHHQAQQNGFGKAGPKIKVGRSKACGGNNTRHLECRMTKRIGKISVERIYVPRNEHNRCNYDSNIKPQFLVAEHRTELSEQDQIITAEVDAKEGHEHGGHILQVGRIGTHGIPLDSEAAGAGGAEGGADCVEYRHIAKEQERINAGIDPNDIFALFSPKPLPAEYIPSKKQLAEMAKNNDAALITIGRTSGEFLDRYIADFHLSEAENALIKSVCDAFHAAGKKVAVVLNIGGVIETASWKDMPDAILCAWQAGQEGGNSVADVLKGKASPSGKLTMTFPMNYADHGSSANFPIDEVANTNIINNAKTSFDRKNVDYTVYEEGIYVGYRWFDTKGLEVSYPFGYGLSYTTFEYSNPVIVAGKNETTVTVEVKNTGAYAGKEVVQLYVSAPKGALDKPAQELKAFAKTAELQPGESQVVTLVVKNEDLASFDEAQSAWVVDAGTYKFHIGASSRDIKATLEAGIKGSARSANNVLNLQK